MITEVLMVADGSADLVHVALQSLRRWTPSALRCVVVANGSETDAVSRTARSWGARVILNPGSPIGATAHAAGIHAGRSAGVGQESDLVVLLDNDTAVLSAEWWRAMQAALHDPAVGLWSCGFRGWPHPVCLAMRAPLFRLARSFYPLGAFDTAAAAVYEIIRAGWQVRTEEHGARWIGNTSAWGRPVHFVHLGGGTHSQWGRLTWRQRARRLPALIRRARFKRAVADRTHGV